ncbi:hypothetical protein CVT24_012563 [Panaeolus cyanescens]|uniref:Uncharacterized protein n=1 Tax=Panaeolus cyanescens TaxID=181874 RepID=A0A409W2I2_9AGAR|nr:hypothetical protein CVT24_012563 [Panaeolus cyanescens]
MTEASTSAIPTIEPERADDVLSKTPKIGPSADLGDSAATSIDNVSSDERKIDLEEEAIDPNDDLVPNSDLEDDQEDGANVTVEKDNFDFEEWEHRAPSFSNTSGNRQPTEAQKKEIERKAAAKKLLAEAKQRAGGSTSDSSSINTNSTRSSKR